ncbi:MAG: 50S ribosomal protein L10 [Bacteroidia bacterium]
MRKEQKQEVIDQLAVSLTQYKNVYVTDVASLNAEQTSNLRRELFKNGIIMQVAKNTLIEKAIQKTGRDFGDIVSTLKGNTALMFCEDIKAPAKVIKEFRKKGDKPVLKGACIDTDVFLGDKQLDALMALKTKNELIGDIINTLQSPAKNVISALKSGGGKIAGIVKTLSERPE